jgi:hypothetical protein
MKNQLTYYLKDLSPPQNPSLKTYRINPSDPSDMISYEEYNRRFIRDILEITVPESEFFKEGKNYFIGSKKIHDLTFFDRRIPYQDIQKLLGPKKLAEHTVLTTFINDLNRNNWGYDKNGLVIIDADSVNAFPDNNINAVLKHAAKGLEFSYPTVDALKEMQKIYQSILDKPLPPSHVYLPLDREVYIGAIKILIECCQKTIDILNESNEYDEPAVLPVPFSRLILISAIRGKIHELENEAPASNARMSQGSMALP